MWTNPLTHEYNLSTWVLSNVIMPAEHTLSLRGEHFTASVQNSNNGKTARSHWPEEAARRGVRIALKWRILRPEEKGQDGGRSRTQRVTHNHQPIVHRPFTLRHMDRHKHSNLHLFVSHDIMHNENVCMQHANVVWRCWREFT